MIPKHYETFCTLQGVRDCYYKKDKGCPRTCGIFKKDLTDKLKRDGDTSLINKPINEG